MNRQQQGTFWNIDQIMRVLEQKIAAMPPAERFTAYEWFDALTADLEAWKRAAQRGRRTLADRQAEMRVGLQLQRCVPRGWVQIQ